MRGRARRHNLGTHGKLGNGRIRYQPIKVFRDAYFSLDRDTVSGRAVFSICRMSGHAEWDEFYEITEEELARFLADDKLARAFALLVERHLLKDRYIAEPFSSAAVPRGDDPASAPPEDGLGQYLPIYVSRQGRYSLERDRRTGEPIFSIPVSSSYVEYDENYRVSEEEFVGFLTDAVAAKAFANECGRHEHDDRLVRKPGAQRGSYE